MPRIEDYASLNYCKQKLPPFPAAVTRCFYECNRVFSKTLLLFEPCEEIVDAGAADGHFKRSFRLGNHFQAASNLLDDACY